MKKAHEQVTTVTPESPGIPRAMVLTVSFVLSPVTGLFCHRYRRSFLRQLDTSVGVSGPHDFAVRVSTIRQAHFHVHRIPPHVGDVRNAPLPGQDGGSRRTDLPDGLSGIFFAEGLDKQRTGKRSDLPVGQINRLWVRHCEPAGRRKAPPDDKLREAIHRAAKKGWIASSLRSSQ
jgi:hypothetical protein